MRNLVALACVLVGCAAGPAATHVDSTSATRLAWLRAEVARTERIQELRGSYLPRTTPGAAIACATAISIDAWYGVGDEKWSMTKAGYAARMPMAFASSNLREELARIGIRDCILDLNR